MMAMKQGCEEGSNLVFSFLLASKDGPVLSTDRTEEGGCSLTAFSRQVKISWQLTSHQWDMGSNCCSHGSSLVKPAKLLMTSINLRPITGLQG